MKNRTKKFLTMILCVAMSASLMAGCGAASSDGPAASSGKTYRLAFQCAFSAGGGPYVYCADLADKIVECSGGRVSMDCLATNSIVSTIDMLDAVANGTLDCAQTIAVSFPDDSLGILSTLPVGMTAEEYMGWYLSGEGQQILDEVMMEISPNVVAFPCAAVDAEILYHSTTPIERIEDIKGLKIRGLSDWAKIETMLGASVVTMDGGECYEALSRGTIDAAEYSTPFADYAAGYHEVAPYLTVPGIHCPAAVHLFLINRNLWDGMDEQLQNIIKNSCKANLIESISKDRIANVEAWGKFKALEDEGKLTIFRLPEEDIDTIKEVAADYYSKKCDSNPLFAKVYNSQQEYLNNIGSWSEASDIYR